MENRAEEEKQGEGKRGEEEMEGRGEQRDRNTREKPIEMTNLTDTLGCSRRALKFLGWSCPLKPPSKAGDTAGLAGKAPSAWGVLDQMSDRSETECSRQAARTPVWMSVEHLRKGKDLGILRITVFNGNSTSVQMVDERLI